MLFFCLKAQALQEFKVEKRTSIYDLDDNLLVDLKKGDSVCICEQASSSFHAGEFLNVCNNDNEIIGKLANGNEALGAWVTPSCSQGYTIQEKVQVAQSTTQEYIFCKEEKIINGAKVYFQGAFNSSIGNCESRGENWKQSSINVFCKAYKNSSSGQEICKGVDTKKIVKQENTTPKKKAEQVVVATTNLDKKSLKEELKYWKELFEDELITQKEYDAKRKALLEGGVTVTQTKKTTKPKNEIVKKAKVDKSYKNKDYLYPKIGKRFNAWRTSKIINRCMSDYKKILESIECTKDNIRATNRYKKGRLYMDLYNLHLNSIEGVETAMLNGQITESQAKNYILQLNSQTISSIELRDAQDDAKRAANKQRGDALMKLGQEMMKPGFDWTTGTSSSTNQNNNNSFQNSNRKPCMYNFATNEYQQCVHLGADQVCYHFTLPCTP